MKLCIEKYVARIEDLEKKLEEEMLIRNKNENNNRKLNVEISGVPVTKGENCKQIVANIGGLMGLSYSCNDFDIVHRLSQKDQNHAPNIIVRFYNRTDRDTFYSNRTALKSRTIKDLGYESSGGMNKIFINESLSIYTKKLFKESRDICKSQDYESCYVNGGTVYVKKSKDDSKKLQIHSFKDLDRLLPQ